MKGSTYKRCKCRDKNGRELGTGCPKLRRPDGSYAPGHGSWYYRLELDAGPDKKRRTVKRGGYELQREAQDALDDAKGKAAKGVDVMRRLTVAAYLAEWTAGLGHLRRNTRRSYTQHVESLWTPQLGGHDLGKLRRSHVQDALDSLDVSPATKQRYRATLRAALNDAMREGLVDVNVATLAKIEAGKRPKARPWTDARVMQWQAEYELRLAVARERSNGQPVDAFKLWHDPSARPSPVMVWTPAQVGRFLDHAYGHRWYALYHVIAFRGLRRGEACGMRRQDLDLAAAVLTVAWQITKGGGQIDEGAPKTDVSDADVPLDVGTVAVLRDHLAQQGEQRREWGSAWQDSGYVFTGEDGSRLDPDAVTDGFERLAFAAGLPPIRLHDLRHSAASIMHAGGVEMKTISKTLRHSTITITSDTYTSVFEDVDRAAAEAAAAVVPLKPRAANSA